MKNWKRIVGIVIILIILFSAGNIVYKHIKTSMQYTINNNQKDIQAHLTQWQNRGEVENPTLLRVEHLGDSDTYIAFFENENDELGIAILKEGTNQKLRIRESRSGDGDYNYYGVSTNKGSYITVTARNLDKDIHSINVKINDGSYEYTVPVPKEPVFMITKKLPKGTSSDPYADIYFFDKNKNEIEQ